MRTFLPQAVQPDEEVPMFLFLSDRPLLRFNVRVRTRCLTPSALPSPARMLCRRPLVSGRICACVPLSDGAYAA